MFGAGSAGSVGSTGSNPCLLCRPLQHRRRRRFSAAASCDRCRDSHVRNVRNGHGLSQLLGCRLAGPPSSTTGNAFKPSECCTYIVASVLKTCGFFQQLHVNKATSRTQHSHTRVGSGQGKARRVQSARAASALAPCQCLLVDTIDSLTPCARATLWCWVAAHSPFRFSDTFHIDCYEE